MKKPKITVVGSLNMDMVLHCDQLPKAGQTVLAKQTQQVSGGKGANQAVAAAKAGGNVKMLGCVGDDVFGGQLIDNLNSHEIDSSNVRAVRDCASGIAIVTVDELGENSIVVSSGANLQFEPAHITECSSCIENSDILLIQLEIPLETVEAALQVARKANIQTILDPAPVTKACLNHDIYGVDVICPNQIEAEILTGIAVHHPNDAIQASERLMELGAKNAIVTLSSQGTVIHDGHRPHFIEPYSVTPVDSTAAGDAFAGAFSVKYVETGCLLESTRYAAVAGALSVTKKGAQPSMPTNEEILLAMAKLK